MKTITTTCLALLLFSCFSKDRETRKIEGLNHRITHLEQRMDSLVCGGGVDSIIRSNKKINRCQAITQRGKQCKRRAKSDGYCWQHAG